ncbi:MAG: AEC family transporter [Roseburia sp.]
MEILLLLIQRLLVMFLFILIGAALFKKGRITEKGSESLANLLITWILPCVIIRSFLIEPTGQQMRYLCYSLLLSFVLLIISILIAKVLFKKDAIANFAAAFSNPGFFGIPLISAILGDAAVLFVAPFIAYLNIFQCTYGVATLKKEKININAKTLLGSPFLIGFAAGLILFFLPVTLPQVLEEVVVSSANLNTPVAMLVLGVYLVKVDIKAMLHTRRLYNISLIRLVVIPLVCLGVLALLPTEFYQLKMCLLIAAACPVGTNVAVYAQLHGKNYGYAAECVVISTLLSAISIPAFVMMAQFIWNL